MLRPPDPAISLNFLARMLGGKAKFDPGTGMWVLPHGGPGDPMRFRLAHGRGSEEGAA